MALITKYDATGTKVAERTPDEDGYFAPLLLDEGEYVIWSGEYSAVWYTAKRTVAFNQFTSHGFQEVPTTLSVRRHLP